MTETQKPYHHGDLPTALLAAAETLLEADGIQALTLRAVARAVGVSHTAPQNHFGDLTGLLSELAGEGYQRFAAATAGAVNEAGDAPRARNQAMARAYIGFAQAHPGLFTLMFRTERLDFTRPALRQGADAARNALMAAVTAKAARPLSRQESIERAAATWSFVHGFAVLLLEGRLKGMIASMGETIDEAAFFDGVFSRIEVGPA